MPRAEPLMSQSIVAEKCSSTTALGLSTTLSSTRIALIPYVYKQERIHPQFVLNFRVILPLETVIADLPNSNSSSCRFGCLRLCTSIMLFEMICAILKPNFLFQNRQSRVLRSKEGLG
jgi:hypothetical protein